MTTYDKYCPGKNCKKRHECAMHQFSNICTNFPSLADWSQENFGQYECGDNGNYQYFIPKETPDLTDKQIVEDFLHFLSSKKGIINTGNYTYSYQELRNALISYHKETAATAFCGNIISDPDIVSKIKKQMSMYPDEHIEQAKKKLIESFSKQERHPIYSVVLQNPEEISTISKEQIEQFKGDLEKHSEDLY